MNEPPALASLSLTHVRYDPRDAVSYASAWLALAPQALMVMYVTLIWATRETEILLMFIGQMGCEALNFALKRYIKEERPKQMHGKGYGMPSSHAQFVAYFSVYLTLFLLLRHVPGPSTSYSPSTFLERLLLSILALGCAVAVATSRVYLNYHTPKQIWVGASLGILCAVAWFTVGTILRRSGRLDWILDTSIARKVRLRDLITTEDLQDAGWGRFEDRRRLKRSNASTKDKKSR